jgi:hypothetical protein
MNMTRKPSEEEQRLPVAGAAGAEELYQRYLRIRAEKNKSRNEADHPITELQTVNSGDALS